MFAKKQPDKDCAFTPTRDKCKPDAAGNCPSGFSKNVNNDCIPNKCPKGFVKQDNDETGKCFAKKIKSQLGKVRKALNDMLRNQP